MATIAETRGASRTHNAVEQFMAAIRAVGMEPPRRIQPGKWHRFPGIGKTRGDSGRCFMFPDMRGGIIQDLSEHLNEYWQIDIGRAYTPEERRDFRQRCESERLARDAELLRQHEAAANNAVEILAAAVGDPAQHPYALKKDVSFGPLVKRGLWPQRGWDDALLIPLCDENGKIWTLEAINTDGEKDYLKGGRKRGGFHLLGKIRGAVRILIGEGLATVAVAHAVDGSPAVAAMDSGNLLMVSLIVRKLAPDAEIIFLADNDIKQDGSNPGLKAATEAAQAVGGHVAVPELDGRKCDFWDVWHERGPDAVRAQILAAVGSTVPPKAENEEVRLLASSLKGEDKLLSGDAVFTSDIENTEGTQGTEGTATAGAACSGSLEENTEGTQGTDDDKLEQLDFDGLDMPGFIVKDEWFKLGGIKRKSGVWYCYHVEGKKKDDEPIPKAVRICSPLHIDGVTNTENGQYFGRLLRFRDTLGRWRKWAMPMELLRGSCEELRGELLAAGVEIEQNNRNHLATYLQWRTPKTVITAATRTGWTQQGGAFVLRDRIIGAENVHFQSENIGADGAARSGGGYRQWQAIAALCEGNPVLIVSICVSLAGALLAKVPRDSGGVHWVGDSSTGKTTALIIGASVWGGADFKRTWRATSNGLEGVAALLSDTCLCLDEINEADPREVGAIVYSLGNGTGKTRATRIGSARHVHRWRLSLLSTGERSLSAAMQEGGKQAKAGQLVRLLNIPAARKFGVFDDLHDFDDGRQFADHFKTECDKHYGHAGIKFVEHILQEGNADFGAVLAKLETQFKHDDTQAARAASRFALYAMAGEMAIEAGIVPWKTGAALNACKVMFDQWKAMRGSGATEHRQILQSVADYILKYGDSKFTDKDNPEEKSKIDRAGWYTDKADGRVYLFTSEGLKAAGGNYDFKRVLDALDSGGWIVERSNEPGKRSKKTTIPKVGKPPLYWIKQPEECEHA